MVDRVQITSFTTGLAEAALVIGRGDFVSTVPTDLFRTLSLAGDAAVFSATVTERRVEVIGLVAGFEAPMTFDFKSAWLVVFAGTLKH